ncbi:MAG: inorganic diphosphatase [Myxococcales bacterium]
MRQDELTVVVDVPRGSFLKRDDHGAIDFVSPLPCPFNYGHVPGTLADDGEAFDALILGRRLPRGSKSTVAVRGRVDFIDSGRPDPKWICAGAPMSARQRLQVEIFFRFYAAAKRLINRFRGKTGPTRYLGWL